ncbi:MAG: hypothetical protein U0M48_06405, partial [Xylanibacter rarus]
VIQAFMPHAADWAVSSLYTTCPLCAHKIQQNRQNQHKNGVKRQQNLHTITACVQLWALFLQKYLHT